MSFRSSVSHNILFSSNAFCLTSNCYCNIVCSGGPFVSVAKRQTDPTRFHDVITKDLFRVSI